jgi:hypothetical protein
MTSSRIERPASRRPKICEPADWSRGNLDRPPGRLGGRLMDRGATRPVSVVKQVLEVGTAFDYRSRSLLKVRLDSLEERSTDARPSALFQGNFIRNVPKLRMLFKNRVDSLSEPRVFISQIP